MGSELQPPVGETRWNAVCGETRTHGVERGKSLRESKAYLSLYGLSGEKMALEGNYDLIVLDVMLPKRSGLEVLKNFRSHGRQEPVLMLTAKDSLEDKVRGLNLGADDYLVKPFEADELLARVNALTRRVRQLNETGKKIGDISIHRETSEITVGGKNIALTAKEFNLLSLLVKNLGNPVSKKEIIDHVWGSENGASENSVELYIHYLRKKLKDSSLTIKTIRGQGYRLVERE